MDELKVIGKSVPFVDGVEKVTGKAIFGADVKLPNMLYGKVLRSPYPRARIIHIDTSKAERLPGVRAVATGLNTPDNKFGPAGTDERFFVKDFTHYIGDEIAAVAAISEDIAKESLTLIDVEYEVLPAVFDPFEAMQPGAPIVHADLETNIAHHVEFERGDVKRGFDQAKVIHEEVYSSQFQYQSYIEPNTATAAWSGDRLTIWAPIQLPRAFALAACRGFNIPRGSFRFIQTFIGGGFGGKAYQRIGLITAAVAQLAGAPVQITLEREEDMQTSFPRVPMQIRLKMGVDENGLITAKDTYILADNGAYTIWGIGILNTTASRVDSLYRFKNIKVSGDLVYTNKIASGMFRGFGNPQAHFPVECMLDVLAEKLGMDPIEIRLRNATQTGDVTAHGWKMDSCGLNETIKTAAKASNWESKWGKQRNIARGIGIGCGLHVSGNRAIAPDGDGSSAQVRINEDGSVRVATSEGDIGQGAKTVFAQIAAEVLCVPYEKVIVESLDTNVTFFGVGAGASRVTTLGGNAVKAGAIAAKERLIKAAADQWNCQPEEIQIIHGKLVNINSEKEMEIGEAATHYIGMTGGSRLMGEGFYVAKDVVVPDKQLYGNVSIAYSFATHIAEVEVDLETGVVKVIKLTAVHDSGRIINPRAFEGQVEGGLVMGMGYALGEEMVINQGCLMNPNFTDYKVPTIRDVPEMEVHTVDVVDPNGPFGAKSVGEMAMVPTAPAIANAIYDAIGIRFTSLPITPERVLNALREKKCNIK